MSLGEKVKKICASTVKSVYKLKPSDLDEIEHDLVRNPHYSCAPCMRLYDEDDVRAYVFKINDPEYLKRKEQHKKEVAAHMKAKQELKKKEKEREAEEILNSTNILFQKANQVQPANYYENGKDYNQKEETKLSDLPNDILCKISNHMVNDVAYDGLYGPDIAAQDFASLSVCSKSLKHMANNGFQTLYRNIIQNVKQDANFSSLPIEFVDQNEDDLRSLLVRDERSKKFTKKSLDILAKNVGLRGYTVMNKNVLTIELLEYIFEDHLDKLWVNSCALSKDLPLLLPYIILLLSKREKKWNCGIYANSTLIKYLKNIYNKYCFVHSLENQIHDFFNNDDYLECKKARQFISKLIGGYGQNKLQELYQKFEEKVEDEKKKRLIQLGENENMMSNDFKKKCAYFLYTLEDGPYRNISNYSFKKYPICDRAICSNIPSNLCRFKCCKFCCANLCNYIEKNQKSNSMSNVYRIDLFCKRHKNST